MDTERFKRKILPQLSDEMDVCDEKLWLIVELDEEEFIEKSNNEESSNEESEEESGEEPNNDALKNEESSDEYSSIDLFKQFSVSATPDKWVHLRNKILCCFWPKTDPGKKIKSCEVPKETGDENWTVHRCRILMNGVKFKSYKEAKEAEKIAENCSTLSEFKANYGRKRLNENNETISTNKIIKKSSDFEVVDDGTLESTMDFDVESFSEDTSPSDTDDSFLIVGNDSFVYNEIVKYEYLKSATNPNGDIGEYNSSSDTEDLWDGNKDEILSADVDSENSINATYSVQKEQINDDNEDLSNTINSPSDNVDVKFGSESDESGYSQFKLTSGECFTSTLLKDHSPQSNAELKNTNTFVFMEKEIGKGIDFESFEPNVNSGSSADSIQKNISSHIAKAGLIVSEFNSNMQQELHQLDACVKLLAKNKETSSVPMSNAKSGENVAHELPKIDVQNIEVLEVVHLEEKVPSASSKVEILDVQILNAPVHSDEILIDVPNATAENTNSVEILIDVPNATAENTTLGPEMKLPICNKDHYNEIQDLIEEKSIEEKSPEDVLTEYLLPFADEAETKYMDRAVDLLFSDEENFFVDAITWKQEKDPNRVIITDSNILQCWMRSYATKFAPDDKDCSKFKAHFRRIKAKKRAAKIAEKKKALKLREKK